MAHRKPRRRRRRLIDMSTAARQPPRYVAPAHDAEYDEPEDLGPDVRVHRVGRYRDDRLVAFAVALDRWTGGRWQHVARIDTAHGEVHRHRYLPSGGEERTVLQVIGPERAGKTLEMWFARAVMMVDTEWRDLMKEWTGGIHRG